MAAAAVGLTSGYAITYFVAAIELVVTVQFADLVVTIALVLALGLNVVASIGASRGEHSGDGDEKYFYAHALALQFESAGVADNRFRAVGFIAPDLDFGA
jgi:hypothetical protein